MVHLRWLTFYAPYTRVLLKLMKTRVGKYVLILWGLIIIILPAESKKDLLQRRIPTFPKEKISKQTRYYSHPLKGSFASRYLPVVFSAARDYGLPVELIAAIIKVESGFNPYAVSPKGAVGLMQLMPETSQLLGIREPYNPVANIYGGVRYFRYLIDRYNGNVYLALAAYNAGPGAVEKNGLRIPPYSETANYIPKVINYYKRFYNAWRRYY